VVVEIAVLLLAAGELGADVGSLTSAFAEVQDDKSESDFG
jgi:hypothetical protein